MKRLLLVLFSFCTSLTALSQNLSYSCPRDTILGCSNACINITAKIPDIKSLSTDYIVSNVSAVSRCRPYVDPGGAGPSVNIVDDDLYSGVITIPFNFVFYGRTYNRLVVSPNGVICFDITRAGAFAHYATTAGNLPNTAYDRAIIMGAYHDMDIRETISPNRKIKYNTIGTAPNRKWILSFYKMPLFYNGNGCNVFFENTHQIIIHESSGLVEVHMVSRQPCNAWQNGKGMIGMQDSFQLRSIIAPGRGAADPNWGTVNMNEVWRFIPKNGSSLYRSVQLLDGNGTVVANGDTTRADASTFNVSFNNVCPPLAGTNVYVVKTTYQKIDDPTGTFFSLDTINVVRQAALPFTATSTSSTCGASTGTITVNVTGGIAPYRYSINGGTFQTSNVFTNIASGTYDVYAVDSSGCNDTISVFVNSISTLAGTVATTATGCPGVNNGTAIITPTSGQGPFQFYLDGSTTFQTSGTFTGLSAGSHSVVFVDANNCSGTVNFSITAGTSLSATSTSTNATCTGATNGTITITSSTGNAPFTYNINSGPYQTGNIFTGLAAGVYLIGIKDSNNCTGTRTVTIGSGATLAATTTFSPTACTGINNGSITITMTNGTAPYRFTLDGGPVQTSATNVFTFTNVSAGAHLINITDSNGCTTLRAVNVTSSSGISASTSFQAASCPGVNNGSITIRPTNGTRPFTYSIDGGPPQADSIFTGLSGGNHTVVYTDANGCSGTSLIGIPTGTAIIGSAVSTPAFCSFTADGTVTVTTNNGVDPFTYAIDGGSFQTDSIFTGVAPGPHTVTFKDFNGCTGTAAVNVATGPGLTASALGDSTSCPTSSNGTVTVTPNNGTGPYSYSIDGGPAQADSLFINLTPGIHNVLVTDANGCTGGTNAIVPLGAPISISATSGPASCAAATNGTVTIIPSRGSSPFTFSVDAGPGQSNPSVTGIAPGNHTANFTDADGCIASIPVLVGFGPDPIGSAFSTPTACPGVNDGTVTVQAPTQGGSNPFTYSIDNGPFQTDSVFTSIAAGNHIVAFTDANGCSGTAGVVVNQGNNITSVIVPANPPCAFINNGTIEINPTSGTGPYEFALNGGTYQSSNTFIGLAPGSYTIDIRNIGGCTGSNTAVLTTNTPVNTSLSMTMPLCNGNNNGTITVSASGGLQPYTYSIDGGTNYQSASIITGLTAGPYSIRIRDSVGCIKDTSLLLNEPPVLTASATSTPASCGGNDGTISITASGGTPAYTYSVNNGTSFQPGSNFTVADGTYPDIIVRDANQCRVLTNVTVDRIDNMFLTLSPSDTNICRESSITMQPQTNPQTSIFNWSSPDAPASTINNPNSKNAVITPVDTSVYYLYAQWGVCERRDTIRLNVLLKPIANAGLDSAICFDQQLCNLHGSASNTSGPVSFQWSPAALVAAPTAANTTALINNTTDFTLTVTDNYGCNFNVTDVVRIAKQPPVPAFAGNDTIASTGVPIQLHASGGASYLWSPATYLDNPYSNTPKATILFDTKFIVIVNDIAGCVGSDTIFVKVYDGPTYYVPNAFSPNGDGLNDIFRPVPVGMVKTDYFRIFNRFGETIFQTSEWMKGWDGTMKGRQQPPGTYVWILKGTDVNGQTIQMKGTVTLIR